MHFHLGQADREYKKMLYLKMTHPEFDNFDEQNVQNDQLNQP